MATTDRRRPSERADECCFDGRVNCDGISQIFSVVIKEFSFVPWEGRFDGGS